MVTDVAQHGPDRRTRDGTLPQRLLGWGAERDLSGLDDPELCKIASRDLSAEGLLGLPYPAGGNTPARLAALRTLGRLDLTLGRLAEAHTDAAAILAELGGDPPARGTLWGVWAADPPHQRLGARHDASGWRLDGVKPWCSGAAACTHGVVSAHADDGYRLFVVDTADPSVRPVEGTWPAYAMPGSDSRSLRFDGAPAAVLGGPGAYLDRPGFWYGAIGVAAVWLGGAEGVADALHGAHARRPLHEHALAHAGAVDAALHAARVVVERAGAEIDADPKDADGQACVRALRTRAVVESAATDTVERVGRALGAAPLALDRAHGRRVADLALYLRQSHAERDLADLGERVLPTAEESVQ
ncbi:MAG: acyl-CoA dehydrogenase [Streptosporangiales bacterium]